MRSRRPATCPVKPSGTRTGGRIGTGAGAADEGQHGVLVVEVGEGQVGLHGAGPLVGLLGAGSTVEGMRGNWYSEEELAKIFNASSQEATDEAYPPSTSRVSVAAMCGAEVSSNIFL